MQCVWWSTLSFREEVPRMCQWCWSRCGLNLEESISSILSNWSNIPRFGLGWITHPIPSQHRPNYHPLSLRFCSLYYKKGIFLCFCHHPWLYIPSFFVLAELFPAYFQPCLRPKITDIVLITLDDWIEGVLGWLEYCWVLNKSMLECCCIVVLVTLAKGNQPLEKWRISLSHYFHFKLKKVQNSTNTEFNPSTA